MNKVYNEVIEVLKYASDEEYEKIPSNYINYYEQNKDKTYHYSFDANNTSISKKASVLLIKLYLTYIASEEEKKEIYYKLKQNDEILENEKREKYDSNIIFNKNDDLPKKEEQLVKYKEKIKWYEKIWNTIINIFKRK